MTVDYSTEEPSASSNLPNMIQKNEKKSQTRLYIAASLFVASIAASFLISYISHQGQSYWVVKSALPKGVQIDSADLQLVQADLAVGIFGYLGSAINPVGSITLRNLQAGEILNAGAISEDSQQLTSESLSISVRASDLPPHISIGEMVALYQVHDARNGEQPIAPERVLSGVFVRAISQGGSNFGSDISLTLSLNRESVPVLLAATSSGRIVVVSTHG